MSNRITKADNSTETGGFANAVLGDVYHQVLIMPAYQSTDDDLVQNIATCKIN